MIDYWTSSIIWLSLEDYHNKGIKPERSKELIEGINRWRLWCEPSRINNNWNVRTQMNDPSAHYWIVRAIEFVLEEELERMKNS